MRIPFTKMHGLGNDYIFLNCLDGTPLEDPQLPGLARRLSDRNRGVGSDGLILVLPPPAGAGEEFGFRMYNRDGSEGEMCGNGMRCFARYVVSRGLTGRREFEVATKAGPIRCWVTTGPLAGPWQVTVDLGVPGLRAAEVPTTIAPGADGMVVDQPFQVDGGEFRLTAVSTGVPHAVVFLDRLAGRPWQDWGRAIEGHPAFPRRTNVEFAQVISPARAEVVVWERGSGATLACGTGAGAVVVAGVLTGRLSRQATISLPGGELEVGWRQADSRLLLTGPAVEVCRGEYLDPA